MGNFVDLCLLAKTKTKKKKKKPSLGKLMVPIKINFAVSQISHDPERMTRERVYVGAEVSQSILTKITQS